MKNPHIIVSGQAGHGKDSVGSYLIEHHGYVRTAFGDPLKEEVFDVYAKSPEKVGWDTVNGRDIKEIPLHRLALAYCSDSKFKELSLRNFEAEDSKLLPIFRQAIEALDQEKRKNLQLMGRPAEDFFAMDRLKNSDLMNLPRSFRRICQLWGTEHRRGENGNTNYWVDQIDALVDASESPMVITDGRFANECDWAHKKNVRRINVTRPASAMSAPTEEMQSQMLEGILTNRMVNWMNAPGIEPLMQLVHAKMAFSASKQPKHSSEMIPPVDQRTADLVNDGTLVQLHEKTEEALQTFIKEARPRLAL